METARTEPPVVLPPRLRAIDAALLLVTKAILVVIGLAFTLMISAEVASRFLFSYSISQVNALSQIMLVWFFLLGASLAMRQGAHVGLDILSARLRGVPATVVGIVANLFVLAFFAQIIYGSVLAFTASVPQFDGTLGISMGWVMAAFPVGFGLLVYHQLVTVVEATLRSRRAG